MKRISIIILSIIAITITTTYVIYNIYIRRDITKVSNENINKKEKMISRDLRIGITNFDTINPILSSNINVQNISRLIFEPLLNLTYDYKLEESLATEWTKLNTNTYLIKLRKNVKWQNERNFDSDDVIYTIDLIKKLKEKSIYYYNVENIKEVKKIDKHTIKIITTDEVPYFEYNLIFPIVSSKYFNKENLNIDRNIMPPGTGMYYIEDKNKENIELKINANWWKEKKLKVNNISINLYKNINEEIRDIELNKLDLITTSATDINEIIDKSKCNIKKYIGRNYDYIAVNCKKNMLKNRELRKAINYGINKNEIIEKVYNNNYVKSEFPLDFGCYLYKKIEENNYNKEKAKRISKENKLKNVNLNILINKNNDDKIKLAYLIKEQLNAFGIEIHVVEKNEKEYEKDLENSNFDLAIISNTYTFSPSLNSYFEEGNLNNYDNFKIRKILNNIENIPDEDARKEIENIKELYYRDVPFVSLFYNTNTLVYSKNLKGEISPNSYNIFYNIENWYMEYDK